MKGGTQEVEDVHTVDNFRGLQWTYWNHRVLSWRWLRLVGKALPAKDLICKNKKRQLMTPTAIRKKSRKTRQTCWGQTCSKWLNGINLLLISYFATKKKERNGCLRFSSNSFISLWHSCYLGCYISERYLRHETLTSRKDSFCENHRIWNNTFRYSRLGHKVTNTA